MGLGLLCRHPQLPRRLQRDFPLLGEVGGNLLGQLHQLGMPRGARVFPLDGPAHGLVASQASQFAGTLFGLVGHIALGAAVVTEVEPFVDIHTQRAVPLVMSCPVAEWAEGLHPSAPVATHVDVEFVEVSHVLKFFSRFKGQKLMR